MLSRRNWPIWALRAQTHAKDSFQREHVGRSPSQTESRYIADEKIPHYGGFACLHWAKQSQHNTTPVFDFKQHASVLETDMMCNTSASIQRCRLSLFHRRQLGSVTTSAAGLQAEQQHPPILCLNLLYRRARWNKGATLRPWTDERDAARWRIWQQTLSPAFYCDLPDTKGTLVVCRPLFVWSMLNPLSQYLNLFSFNTDFHIISETQ